MKHNISNILTALTLIALTACTNPAPQQENATTEDSLSQTKESNRNVVRRNLGVLTDFSYITNLGSVDIIYTQGDYSIEVEGDSALLQYLVTSFDSNLLTVSMRTDGNTSYNLYGNTPNVTMRLSCPTLQCISICGNGSFSSQGTWSSEDIEIGVLGTGTMHLDSIECNTFKMQITNVSTIGINNLKANEATVLTRTNATVSMNADAEELSILNDGKPNMTLTGRATKLLIQNPKDETLVNKIKHIAL